DEQLTSYEAQVDYYTKFIKSREDWEFIMVYTDEGISAVNTKKRDGFNQMVADALAGGIDLIVTKSVSRFARNTVDSLTTVRKLKEKGVEVWFEKENIYTLDSKGELLITIMSSLAQEESRSISENVTWGQRKRMADGKVTLPYAQFLGYEKGEDGLPRIVPEEAETIRLIYRLFMEGKTFSAIAKYLIGHGVPTPAGKEKWQAVVVRSILQNEKYKGHALMQKTYCANFLTKKMVKNTGQVQQYYVEDSHPAIVDPDEWDAVQAEIERRKNLGAIGRCGSPFSGKIVCGECGGLFGKKVWGSYKDDKTYRREVYQCNEKYKRKGKGGRQCGTPFVTEEDIKARFLVAFNRLMENRDGLIEDCRLAQAAISNTAAIDAEIEELRREIEVVAELSRKAIYENARTAQNQDEFNERNDGYLDRHRKASERVDALEAAKRERLAKGKILDRFILDIEKRPLVLAEFDETVWLTTVDRVTVAANGAMTFTFRNGAEVTA
ncbi:MAG: recombinase family protein, partial [Clostridium sp.]|nr:recombinase family protein [Clostridium sp.]